MIFNLQEKQGIVTLLPSNANDQVFLNAVRYQAEKENQKEFRYKGRFGFGDPPCGIKLQVEEEEFRIEAASEEDASSVDSVACALFRSGRLVFISSDEEGVTFSARLCKWCDKPIITWWENENGVCDACADTCDHDYKRQVAVSGRSVAMGDICTKCNRGPSTKGATDERSPEQIKKELAEVGVHVVQRPPRKKKKQ